MIPPIPTCLRAGIAAILLASCDRSAIRVEITASIAVPAPIDELAILVGSARPPEAALFTATTPEERVAVADRELRDDPYRVLLWPAADGADELVHLAGVAYRAGRAVAAATLPHPVRFVSGQISSWRIELSPEHEVLLPRGAAGCVQWREAGQLIRISGREDGDCDGTLVPDDCDDTRASAHPGAPELCGNALDDDCDARIDEAEPGDREYCDGRDSRCDARRFAALDHCYATDPAAGSCKLGHRACDDTGAGYVTACDPDAWEVPSSLCAAHDACLDQGMPDPLDCAHRTLATRHLSCTLLLTPQGAPCGEPALPLAAGPEPGICRWRLIDGREQRGYERWLSDGQVRRDQLDACTGALVYTRWPPPGAPPDSLLIELDRGDAAPTYRAHTVRTELGCRTGVPALSCTLEAAQR